VTKKPRPSLKVNTGTIVQEASREDLLASVRNDTPTATRALPALHPHPSPSRSLDPKHVVALAHSIAALGLIHPLVIDIDNVLIAGSHRYAALTLIASAPEDRLACLWELCKPPIPVPAKLAEELLEGLQGVAVNPATIDFDRLPVRILPLSHKDNPEDVWQAEVAENERRRDYSRDEIKGLAERLRAQGYKFGKGRPTEGERPALPVLSAVLGKSERQIQRLLQAPQEVQASVEENTTSVAFSGETSKLLKYLTRYRQNVGSSLSDRERKLLDQLRQVLEQKLLT
jgi:ParB family chromosome partitioning protein